MTTTGTTDIIFWTPIDFEAAHNYLRCCNAVNYSNPSAIMIILNITLGLYYIVVDSLVVDCVHANAKMCLLYCALYQVTSNMVD